MSFLVVTTATLEAEFQDQYIYISERSPSGAESWARAFRDALDQLSRIASSCPKAPEAMDHPEVIRQLLFKTRHGRRYRLLFVVRDETVYVIHIRGPRQNLMQAGEIELPDE